MTEEMIKKQIETTLDIFDAKLEAFDFASTSNDEIEEIEEYLSQAEEMTKELLFV